MTDQTTQPAPGSGGATAATRLQPIPAPAGDPTEAVVIAAELTDDQGVLAQGAVAVEGGHALLVARFADTDAALEVYQGLRDGEAAGDFHIDGVLVVKADADGKVEIQQLTDHHTKRGLGWGVVAGVVAGIVFPPSILASAVALGGAGAVLGKIGNIRQKGRVEQAVADVITAGTSGILALVDIQDLPAVTEAMPAAQQVTSIPVDEATAATIEQAATDAGDAPAAPTPPAG
ncbi:MAG: hypothetical protein U0667_10795 [Chloroflexota bacterium]